MDQDIVKIKVEIRQNSGTGVARALRRDNKIPAIVYGKGRLPIKLSLPAKEFIGNYKSKELFTHLLQINIDNNPEFVLLRETQKDPVTGIIEHVDFQFVDRSKEIKINVPILIINENSCMGIKRGGVMNILHSTLPIKCFPDHIPQNIEIDIANLSIGDSIHVNDLVFANDITINLKEDNATIITISSADTDVSSTNTNVDNAAE